MEMFDWLMAPQHILDVLRFASVRPGVLSVIMDGQLLMLMCCAGSWDSPDTVSSCTYHAFMVQSAIL